MGAYVTIECEADVNLLEYIDEFKDEDLINELIDRIQNKSVEKYDLNRLKESLNYSSSGIEVDNLIDLMKFEYFKKVADKYTIEQIERLIP